MGRVTLVGHPSTPAIRYHMAGARGEGARPHKATTGGAASSTSRHSSRPAGSPRKLWTEMAMQPVHPNKKKMDGHVITRGISRAAPSHHPAEEARSGIPFPPHRASGSASRTADDAPPNHLDRGSARGSGARPARAGLMKTHTHLARPTWPP
jgi:hypothetical protein